MTLKTVSQNDSLKILNSNLEEAELTKLNETYKEVIHRFNKSKSLKDNAPYLVFWKENQKYNYMSVSNSGDIAEGYQVFILKGQL